MNSIRVALEVCWSVVMYQIVPNTFKLKKNDVISFRRTLVNVRKSRL